MIFKRLAKLTLIIFGVFVLIFSASAAVTQVLNIPNPEKNKPSFSWLFLARPAGAGGENASALNKDRLDLLVLGVDAEKQRTDVILLVSLLSKNGNTMVLSIPRDTLVVTESGNQKINAIYKLGNMDRLMKEVEKLTGILPGHYLLLDFKALRSIVDAIGGVEIDVPFDMKYDDPVQNLHIDLKKGLQVLNGEKAEQFVRFRMNNDGTGYLRGDLDRIQAQQTFMKAVLNQIFQPSSLLKFPEIKKAVEENVETDIKSDILGEIIKMLLKVRKENVDFVRLPGTAEYIDNISYFIHDPDQTSELIRQFEDGTLESDTSEKGPVETEGTGNYNNYDSYGIQVLNGSPVASENKSGSGQADSDQSLSQGLSKNSDEPVQPIKVEVLNATDRTGLAAKVAEYLKEKGYLVSKIGNANIGYHITTRIIERNDKGYGQSIKNLFIVGELSREPDPSLGVDVTLILGNDFPELP